MTTQLKEEVVFRSLEANSPFCSWYVCRVQIAATWISSGVAGWEPAALAVVKEEVAETW